MPRSELSVKRFSRPCWPCEHEYQLEEKDKKRHAQSFWRKLAHLSDAERYEELCELFRVSRSTIERWTETQRREEKEQNQEKCWEMWLDCWTQVSPPVDNPVHAIHFHKRLNFFGRSCIDSGAFLVSSSCHIFNISLSHPELLE
jgi:hypothetical protein